MAWALHAASHGLSSQQIEHEILNSRDPSKEGPPPRRFGVRHADREQGDRSMCAIKEPSLWRTRHESGAENGRLYYLRTKTSSAEDWLRCHLWGGFANFHWKCFGEYLRADSKQQVESVVWRASGNANAEQSDR
jgi:hypothetical protein